MQNSKFFRGKPSFLVIFLLALLTPFLLFAATGETIAWQRVTWNGEAALTSSAQGWKAIVSLERGRLIYFGRDEVDAPKMIFAPASLEDIAGRGGHRVWLGPQSQWSHGWPPPSAWEKSGPETYTNEHGELRLKMPDAGDGWPRLTRIYRWDEAKLIGRIELNGGTRPAQIIQIIQVPRTDVIEATAQPDAIAKQGYVLLPSLVTKQFTVDFPPLEQIRRQGESLELRHLGVVAKVGFRPQPLVGHNAGSTLTMCRGAVTGHVAGEPDQGFFTQVYLGGPEPFIELEQLSPLFSPDQPASFSITLEGSRN